MIWQRLLPTARDKAMTRPESSAGTIRTRRLILDEAKALVSRTAASSGDQALQELCNAVQSGDVTLEQAAKDLLALVTKAP